MTRLTDLLRRRSTAVSVALLACLAYLPALTAAPGRMPTDSKLYVYLNPGRFIADTTTSFDARQFAGWVPHQHIAYLWPTAPWFWLFDTMGVPDWVAHRLWIGTLLLVAGLGVRWMSRVLGLAPLAALVAGLVYQLSPYVLPYISRTSVLLLPWAGLGWIVGLTVLAAHRGRWRFPAAIALVVLTVGAVNATALAMIIPAPTLWLLHAVWSRAITWRRALATAAKVAVLSTAVSLWWMAMLVIQGRRGADVLAYSESLESVSFTSTSTEVLRGLGYWLFYVRDSFAATTTASIDHLISIPVIAAGLTLVLLCLLGIVSSRWQHGRFAGLLVVAGLVLAVGVHPIDDTSPLMSLLLGDRQSGLALALRSSTRAVPVLVLGLALGAGALVASVRTLPFRRLTGTRASVSFAVAIGVLAVVALPALRNGGFVDPALERDQSPPGAWLDATAVLDDLADGYRVLQVPGTEFGAYQWGYTVDQPLPALTERPLLTRDLLPLGSPAAMDLVFALDDRIQDGTLDPTAVAPVARLLGVDTIWVTNDVQFDRFRLARPELVDAALSNAPGLGDATSFGAPVVMESQVAFIDEESLGDPRVGQPLPPVRLIPVEDPVPTVRVKDDVVLLSGSGDGIVDAAAAGLLDGSELVRYTASLTERELATAIETASGLIITDSNRDRAHHWRSSQDVHGATEAGGPDADVLRFEAADQRLPVFEHSRASSQTIAIQDGPVTATASAYGEPFAYLPEHRPVMAIDGDPATSWLVADRFEAVGEFIRLDVAEAIDGITLRQPDAAPGSRAITGVRIDGVSNPIEVVLDDRSLVRDGQRIDVSAAAGSTIDITITATSAPQPPIAEAIGAVGFAEIDVGLAPTTEFIRVPVDAASADTPATFVFSRLRADPQDRFRSDPEPVVRREFEVPTAMSADVSVTLRADAGARDESLGRLFDEPTVATGHLAGTLSARGYSAVDRSLSTAWITPVDDAIGHRLTGFGPGESGQLRLTQRIGDYSPITKVTLTDVMGSFDVPVDGSDVVVDLPRPVDLASTTLTITDVEQRLTVDRRFGEPVVLPAALSEVAFDGAMPAVSTIAANGECRDDLLTIDGQPVGVTVDLSPAQVATSDGVTVAVCGGPIDLTAGTHRLATYAGSGIDIDRIVVMPTGQPDAALDRSSADVGAIVLTDAGRHHRTVSVPACPAGCWVVLGEGFNEGWSASTDGGALDAPVLVDGNANGWWIEPTNAAATVEITWTPQRTLTIALIASLLAAIAAIAVIIVDRRRETDLSPQTTSPVALGWERQPARSVMLPVALATLTAALTIGWGWAIPAAAIGAVAVITRLDRLLGLAGFLVIVGVFNALGFIVLDERPFPNAGWPVRFEWLHGWTLLGIILIASSVLTSPRESAEPATEPDHDG